jgi:hypothetical protein
LPPCRDSITYEPTSVRSISGIVIERYESGRNRVRSTLANGKTLDFVDEFYEKFS